MKFRIYGETADPSPKLPPKREPVGSTMPMPTMRPPLPGTGLIPEMLDSRSSQAAQAAPSPERSHRAAKPSKRENYGQLPWGHETNAGIQPIPSSKPLQASAAADASADSLDEGIVDTKRRSMPSQEQKEFFWQAARLLFW